MVKEETATCCSGQSKKKSGGLLCDMWDIFWKYGNSQTTWCSACEKWRSWDSLCKVDGKLGNINLVILYTCIKPGVQWCHWENQKYNTKGTISIIIREQKTILYLLGVCVHFRAFIVLLEFRQQGFYPAFCWNPFTIAIISILWFKSNQNQTGRPTDFHYVYEEMIMKA